jgi:hypothetical protein
MLVPVLVFTFFVLLAIVYELHGIADRLIETGTIVEHFNRRDLRDSGAQDIDEEDFASESIRKTHRTRRQTVWGIVIASLVSIAIIELVAGYISRCSASHSARLKRCPDTNLPTRSSRIFSLFSAPFHKQFSTSTGFAQRGCDL